MRCARPARPPRRARNRAFTLIELLVTIALIALLLGILAPALMSARESARAAACLAHLHNIGLALTMYQGAHSGLFPRSSHTAGSVVSPDAWLQSLDPYGISPESRLCPSDEHADDRLTSYATNDHFEPLVAGIDYNPFTHRTLPGGRTRAYLKITDVPQPTGVVYAVEPAGAGTIDHLHSVGWTRAEQIATAIAVQRHNNAANYLYADAHAAGLAWPPLRDSFSASTSIFNPETAR